MLYTIEDIQCSLLRSVLPLFYVSTYISIKLMSQNLYEFFDDIVCINLAKSTDRRKHIENVYSEYKIPGRFYTAQKTPLGGLCLTYYVLPIKYIFSFR